MPSGGRCAIVGGMTLSEVVAANVRHLMREKMVTMTAVSLATGIPERTLARRLSAQPSSFTVDELERVANALRVPPASLLERGES